MVDFHFHSTEIVLHPNIPNMYRIEGYQDVTVNKSGNFFGFRFVYLGEVRERIHTVQGKCYKLLTNYFSKEICKQINKKPY